MSTPEHLGPQDPDEKLKFIGAMITRAKSTDPDYPERVVLCGPRSLHAGSIGKIELHGMNHRSGG
eukprot:937650-Prorocentrum_lima.AAC.1